MSVREKSRFHLNHEIKYYEVEVDNEMKQKCYDFAYAIITKESQYNRLKPENISSQTEFRLRVQRTSIGKLAELAFLKLLLSKSIKVDVTGMFDIYDSQLEVDNYDFTTPLGKTIDVKAAFRSIHQNLVVNHEQFENIPKSFYVGVKLDAKDLDANNKLVDYNSIKIATIYGYADYAYLKKISYCNLGEGLCKVVRLESLMSINKLIAEFKRMF